MQVLKPLPPPFCEGELRDRIGAAMRAYKAGLVVPTEVTQVHPLHAAVAALSARRARVAGIVEDVDAAAS